ncbi:hypothetical protein OHB12_29925 [Nocardia sp. NBC_01730]|uniref:hypothetical protein n=1 Tax=Nocardia sp. NBC_01730 TaxID=2975998 RepID=UPI002E10CA8A|nr:hypothetical protein OHB12_29925 [Nocardia sp. NBC_01730]
MSDFTAPATGNYLPQVSFDTEQIHVGQVRSGMTSARTHRQRLIPTGTVAAFERRGGAGKKAVGGSAPQSHDLGNVRSLVIQPASVQIGLRTRSRLTPDEKSTSRATYSLVRPAVGIQDIDTDPRAGFSAAAS